MLATNAQYFYAIVGNPPAPLQLPVNRGLSFHWPAGTIAILTRLIDGVDCNRLHVQLLDHSDEGLVFRCPIGLTRGNTYRFQVGLNRATAEFITIGSSHLREDDSYEIEATNMSGEEEQRIAA